MKIIARKDEVPAEHLRWLERLRISREARILFSHDTPLDISRKMARRRRNDPFLKILRGEYQETRVKLMGLYDEQEKKSSKVL